MARFSLLVRDGSRTTRHAAGSLDELFTLVDLHVEALERGARDKPAKTPLRDYKPIEQVAGRVQISGPRTRGFGRERAGLDVRGDGSIEAWVGRVSRRLIEQQPGESAVDALRRTFYGRQ